MLGIPGLNDEITLQAVLGFSYQIFNQILPHVNFFRRHGFWVQSPPTSPSTERKIENYSNFRSLSEYILQSFSAYPEMMYT